MLWPFEKFRSLQVTVKKNMELINFLNRLFDTNREFAENNDDSFFDSFKDAQSPKVTILKCSDSRVQMESFDKTPQNGVFAIRNIGNQIATSEGSIDFGIKVLKTPFLLIIGHSDCGAIGAALSKKITNIPAIDHELSSLRLKNAEMKQAIVENINNQVSLALNKYKELVQSGQLVILGAVYDFKNDFGFGKGKIVMTSINDQIGSLKLKQSFQKEIKHFNCFDFS